MSIKSSFFENIEIDPDVTFLKKLHTGQMIADNINGTEYVGLILEGKIDVYSVALDGREIKLSGLTAGEAFGICNLYLVKNLVTVLKASENSAVRMIPKEYFRKQIEQDPLLLKEYLMLCNRKIQFLLRRIEELTMYSSRNRIIEYFQTHCDRRGKVKLIGTRDDLAEQLGMSRATLYRELAKLKAQKLISIHSGEIYTSI